MLSQTSRRFLRPHSLRQLATSRQFQTSTTLRADDAFDPSKTRPEEQSGKKKEDAEHGAAAGANPVGETVNKARDPQEGGRDGSANEDGKKDQGQGHDRSGPSGGGSPGKAGGGKSGGGGH